MEPVALVGLLDQYFTAFDDIVTHHGLEKLETIGDAYMAVAGVPAANRRHPIDTCLAALEMRAVTSPHEGAAREERLPALDLRIGNPYGSVLSGVVGPQKFTFDLSGDPVNTAALMETMALPGGSTFRKRWLGSLDIIRTGATRRNRGQHGRRREMFFLDRLKPEYRAMRIAACRTRNSSRNATDC